MNEIATSGALSFLAGGGIRAVWGEVSFYFSRFQEHKHEMERMRLQSTLDNQRHKNDLEHIQLAKSLGVKEIPFQTGDADGQWFDAIKRSEKPTGFSFIDAWNKSVRPAAATVVLGVWLVILAHAGFKPGPWDLDVMGAVLGFFFADRSLGQRGK